MNRIYKLSAILIVIFLSLTHIYCAAPTQPYAVNNIPKQLLLNANAVVRVDQMVQSMEDADHSTIKVKHAITLLNEKASRYNYTRIGYNQFVKVSGIKAYMYDGEGKLITSVSPEILDVSGNYEDLANDDRFWYILFPVKKYPYTIEYEYTEHATMPYNYNSWSFRSQPDVAVEQSGIQIQTKKGLDLRVSETDLIHKCDTVTFEDKIIYSWQEENLPAMKIEDLILLKFKYDDPRIETAPTAFKMGGINGSMETWESLGKFHYELNKNRDNLSPEFQARLNQMVSNISDPKEKVIKLYDYLQKNTRYVGIQLGIGGYQTLEASFVEKKGYGDCKALTNFMKAILKSVGIKSYQALIQTEEDIDYKFPDLQFNHVILCVPLQQDTVWLECTNQTMPFNYLGDDDGNKHVLILTESGGKLIVTPDYRAGKNEVNSIFAVNIDIMGNAIIKGRQYYNGITFQHPYALLTSGKTEREKFINTLFAAKNLKINNISYPTEGLKTPSYYMDCDILARNFVTKTSKRMVFYPNLFDPMAYLPKYENFDFEIESTIIQNDTTTYSYPFGYKTEYIPEPVKLESKFGNIQWQSQTVNDKLVICRKFELYKNKYSKDDLTSFREFINKIAGIERRLILLIKE